MAAKILMLSCITVFLLVGCVTVPEEVIIETVDRPESLETETAVVPESEMTEEVVIAVEEPETEEPAITVEDDIPAADLPPAAADDSMTEIAEDLSDVDTIDTIDTEAETAQEIEESDQVIEQQTAETEPEELVEVEDALPETTAEAVPVDEEPDDLIVEPETINLNILTTSDIHGQLTPYDYLEERDTGVSLAQIGTLVNEIRAEGDITILLDNGNILQGQPVTYYYNFVESDQPHIIPEVMNQLTYDAGAIGYYDLASGPGVYGKAEQEFAFPWLAANIVVKETNESRFQPYTVIEKGGITCAVISFTDNEIGMLLSEDVLLGLSLTDPVESAEYWLKEISHTVNPDIIVGLYSAAPGSDALALEKVRTVVQSSTGLDVLFCGNIERDIIQQVENADGDITWIIGGGERAEHLASLTIELEMEDGIITVDNQDLHGRAELIPVKDVAWDSAAEERYAGIIAKIDDYFSREIGTLTSLLNAEQALAGDSAYMDFIHQLQMDLTGADISFAAPASADVEIEAGSVEVRDIFRMFPYETSLYAMELTGSEIERYLEFSYGENFTAGGLFDSAAGLSYTVSREHPAGERVIIDGILDPYSSSKDLQPFDPNETYMVVMNSLRANGGGGYLTDGVGLQPDEIRERVVFSTLQDLRLYAIRLFEYLGTYTPSVDENWTIVSD